MSTRFQNSDLQAFEDLVLRYQERIYNLCRYMLRDPEDAQDVAQDVFLKAYRGIKDFRPEAFLYTWLYRIAVNTCLDYKRKARRDAQKLLSLEATGINIVYLRLENPSLLSQVKSRIGKQMSGLSVTSSDSFLELMGGVSKISDQFSLLASIIALGGAIFLIIKTMLANLVARSSEIGILKAVGWTEKDVQKQLMGEALLQSFLGGLAGLIIGYGISYALGMLSIPVSTPWEINLMPAFARDSETTAAVRLLVALSAGLTGAALALSLFAGALASFFMGRRTSRMKPVDILRRL